MEKNRHVHVTLTSISSRQVTLEATLRSILNQSYSNFSVKVYISKQPFLLDEGIAEISHSLRQLMSQFSNLSVTFCENLGPFRKLLPFLRENWGQSKLVVTADDDTLYPDDWLDQLVKAHSKYGCQIAFRGHKICVSGSEFTPYRSWMRAKVEENPSLLLLPTGKDGVLYDTAFFPVEVLNASEALRVSPTADDLWFRWHLARRGVPVYFIKTDYRDTFEEGDYETSLYLNYNRDGKNDHSIRELNKYFIDHFSFSLAAAEKRSGS